MAAESANRELADSDLDQNIANIDVLPLLALRGMLVFPYMTVPLDVGREVGKCAGRRDDE